MNIYYTIDEKYLKAIEKLNWGKAPKAKILLEEILEDEPAYGKAHFLMACIYYYYLAEYELANTHYELAIKFSPEYPDTYKHYMTMLNDLGHMEELMKLSRKAVKIQGVRKSDIYFQIGQCHEKRKDWEAALEYYQDAYEHSLTEDDQEEHEKHIQRVRDKMASQKKWKYVLV